MSPGRVLVAGCGNVFLGDDGFGVEVARRLAAVALPDGVRVVDAGIRSVHLAYEMVEGWDTVVLVDASPRGDRPGTVYLIEPDFDSGDAPVDGHSLTPEGVLALARTLGGELGRVVVVGCEPLDVGEAMGLSAPVAAAVDEAVAMVLGLVDAVPAPEAR